MTKIVLTIGARGAIRRTRAILRTSLGGMILRKGAIFSRRGTVIVRSVIIVRGRATSPETAQNPEKTTIITNGKKQKIIKILTIITVHMIEIPVIIIEQIWTSTTKKIGKKSILATITADDHF